MYARVLEAGILTAGDRVVLEARPNPGLTLYELNDCFYHTYKLTPLCGPKIRAF
jgi:MOSC domain-containing protein YiiM